MSAASCPCVPAFRSQRTLRGSNSVRSDQDTEQETELISIRLLYAKGHRTYPKRPRYSNSGVQSQRGCRGVHVNHYSNEVPNCEVIRAILRLVPNLRKIPQDMLSKATPGTSMWPVKSQRFCIWLERHRGVILPVLLLAHPGIQVKLESDDGMSVLESPRVMAFLRTSTPIHLTLSLWNCTMTPRNDR
ncbi:hypothetical protein BKA70DRAFT_1321685 [Coprinopsis sp. MPI-PUGE-AT-0042]|nr:hypothetical protein BKA70DRAFT_1321685 [Coprinopsis sp. MPI-PUGE-AT-0042]